MFIREISFLIVSVFVTGSICSIHFKYNDCNNSPNKVIHVNYAHLNPHPIVIPGDLNADIQVQALQRVSGHYKLELSIHRHVTFFWVPIPCVSDVGSCTYDLCDLLGSNFGTGNATEGCPTELSRNNLPCHCPFTAGTFTLPPTLFKIPELGSLWSWLASGDYHVDAKLKDAGTGEEVGCYHVELSFTSPCSGLGCFFG